MPTYFKNEKIGSIFLGNALEGRAYFGTSLLAVSKKHSEGFDGLKFVARQANSSVKLGTTGNITPGNFLYSTDNGETWSQYTLNTSIVATNIGDSVCFKADGVNGALANGERNGHRFTGSGLFDLEGNIGSLLNEDISQITTLPPYCFTSLFWSSTILYGVSGVKFPQVSTIPNYAYWNLFRDCSNLVDASFTLPNAEKVSQQGFACLLYNSRNVEKEPTLVEYQEYGTNCFGGMFFNHTKMVDAPYLPFTSVATTQMFGDIFYGCTNLKTVKLAYTGDFGSAFSGWMRNVPSSGTLYYNGSDTTRGTSAIPSGWTIQKF